MKSAVASACGNAAVLRPLDALNPSAYTPRQADPARLSLVELSIRKLGWLLPIYASPEGEILVEKVLGKSADLDRALVDVYYDFKRRMGYTQEEIDRKRLSLEGVLVPVTAEWNEELLHGAGFARVDCVWRWSNFAAWLAVKD